MMRINWLQLGLLVGSLLSSGCATVMKEKKADVSVLVSGPQDSTSGAKKQVSISVPSSSEAVVPGTDPSYFVMRSSELMLSELATVELRRLLLNQHHYRVFSEAVPKADYTIKVLCTELVPDLEQQNDSIAAPTLEAGTLILAISPLISAASPTLPGVGALLQSFEPLTGLALRNTTIDRIGALTIDVQVISRDGRIISAERYPASFPTRMVEQGGISSVSHYKVVVGTYAQDAVRVAVEAAVKKITQLTAH